MKDVMIDVMVNMMPFMKPFMWFGLLVAAAGLLFVLAKYLLKNDNQLIISWSSRIVFAVAIFFLAAQLAGHFLSMPPTINFGDSSKFEFILVSFWQIGLVFLISGLIIKFTGKAKDIQQA